MKKLVILSIALVAILTSCGNDSTKNPETDPEALAAASREELATAIADRDSLLGLVNDINADMQKIKELEGLLTAPSMQGEIPDRRQELISEIDAIRNALAERRQRLQQLERSLAKSKLANAKMQETIDALNAQIEAQKTEIESLVAQLESANERIGNLTVQVDSLNNTVSNVTAERDKAQDESERLTTEINTVYYVYAAKKELKDHNIIEGGGFLSKSKIMQGDFDANFFQSADKRYLKTIHLHAKKAKVLTNQPKDSYEIVSDANGSKVLNILNPNKFWGTSNYLVVQVD